MFTRADEIKCQYEAFKIISNGDNNQVQKFIMYHNMIIAITFRNIINEFENKLNKCPSPDELIYLTSEILNENIREIF